MSPITHLLISWSVANTCEAGKRDRLFITISGVIPDIDGLGIVTGISARYHEHALQLWSKFHHTFGHTLLFCIIILLPIALYAKRKFLVLFLALLNFHLHLFCDLIGSRGPDNYQWPIPYLWPFSDTLQLTWEGQWALNAWPNFLITFCAIVFTVYLAWKQGFSFIEYISKKADQALVTVLRNRFGEPKRREVT